MIKELKCLKCGHHWYERMPAMPSVCPRCGHLYVKWVNYEELAKNAKANGWSGFGQ